MRTIALVLFLLPVTTFGWSETGHRTVCEIAYAELTPTAKAEVDRLIDLDPDYDSFSESCLFADGPPRQRGQDHYLNVPRNFLAIATDECPLADTCLFPAIEIDTNVLADADNPDTDRLVALKLLGHWIGDIHQPMHVSFQDDMGANLIAQEIEDERGNLHSAWDFDIIDQTLGAEFMQISSALRNEITDEQRTLWKFDAPVEWANESYRIAISPEAQYCTINQAACWYAPNNMMLNRGEIQRTIEITSAYTATHSATVRLRLKQAGIRLGARLNSILQ